MMRSLHFQLKTWPGCNLWVHLCLYSAHPVMFFWKVLLSPILARNAKLSLNVLNTKPDLWQGLIQDFGQRSIFRFDPWWARAAKIVPRKHLLARCGLHCLMWVWFLHLLMSNWRRLETKPSGVCVRKCAWIISLDVFYLCGILRQQMTLCRWT